MRRRVRIRIFTVVAALACAWPAQVAQSREAVDPVKQAVAFARDRVYPALVNILVVDRFFSQGRATRAIAAGSGVIVSPAGHVVTNYHVAGTAMRLTCKLPSGERIDADIVCRDPLTDLCVLKLRMEERRDATKPLPFASIGDSAQMEVGDQVLAMGNPQSLSSSITLGIVSNTERVFTSFTGDRLESLEVGSGQQTGVFNQWIQHDALILPGNSGGPLVNLNGEVVAINTRGGGGVGFAVPATTVRKVLNQALTYGEVRRGWVGLSVAPVTPLNRESGALVASVLDGGPAAEAGMQPGDIIETIDGEAVAVRSLSGVPTFLARTADLQPGRTVPFQIEREGKEMVLSVKVARLQKLMGEQRAFRRWGVSAVDISKPLAQARGWTSTEGVLLRSMRPGQPPRDAKPPLAAGDVILEVGGEACPDMATFAKLVNKHKSNKALLVRFRRNHKDMLTVLDMSKKPRRRGSAELSKAWLGVETQVLTKKLADAMNLKDAKGFRVTRVLPTTEAEAAGLQVGDVLTALNAKALDADEVQDSQMLKRRIEDLDIDSKATFAVLREGKPLELAVVLEETPDQVSDARDAEDEILEYKVRELTFHDRVNRDLPADLKALIVATAENGGWASVAGLRGGDVLLKLQGQPIKSIRAFKKATRALHKTRPDVVSFFVRRGRSTTFVFARPDWPDDE